MDRVLACHHVRRDDVIAAERAAPDGIGDLAVAAGENIARAAGDAADDAVGELGGNIEDVGDDSSSADADAFPVDAVGVGLLNLWLPGRIGCRGIGLCGSHPLRWRGVILGENGRRAGERQHETRKHNP